VPINRIRLDDVDIRNITTTTTLINETIADLSEQVDLKVSANSPALTGIPTAPNAPVDTNNAQIANTAFVINQGYLKSTTAQSTYAPISNPTFTGTVNAGATLITNEVLENYNVIGSGIPSTANIDLVTSGIHYYTGNSTTNWTFNFRGDAGVTLNSHMANNQVITATILVTNAATPFRATAFQVDGVGVTPRWADGLVPAAGNANSIDIYTFTILKTAPNAFTVFGSLARFA
jgi:hypothetical protein